MPSSSNTLTATQKVLQISENIFPPSESQLIAPSPQEVYMSGALSALFLTSASTLTLSVHRNLFYYFNTIPGNSCTGIKFTG